MKKITLGRVFALFLCLLLLASCGQPETEVTRQTIVGEMKVSERNWLGMTTEQYLEDFDHLHEQLWENYPFFPLLEREGVSENEVYLDMREKVERCKSDYDFYMLMQEYTQRLKNKAHLGVADERFYQYAVEVYNVAVHEEMEDELWSQMVVRHLDVLQDPETQSAYQAMADFFSGVDEKVAQRGGEVLENATDEPDEILTEILEEGRIAYAKVDSLDLRYYDRDKEALLSFYNEAADFDHLIIDLRKNPGGSSANFLDLIIRPNIDEALTVNYYHLLKGGENNMEYSMNRQRLEEGVWRPVEELPDLPEMNEEDLRQVDYFKEEQTVLEPMFEEPIFKGKIWFLIGNRNYSSSDFGVLMATESGFATTVGRRTSGDGIGVDPVFITLPNSRLLIRYSSVHGVRANGQSNVEFGTEPDYYTEHGSNALDTCLKLIEQEYLEP